MHLRSVEVSGFKSFADRTEIALERGLTAIVGPNGCGKSNIVDAIRWALGEQSARSLRGGAMSDVIFNGGGRRGPVPMAEVTLKFDNSDRVLAVERDEVRVTRRLHRSGESEYLLNGGAARLRDIRELLLDTGAGATAATFVEQGKIDALLHASADERRHVLEEAAGIGKYKLRKKECLGRLDEVSGDRQRLQDLLSEVSARHEEVKKQAEKAGRFVQVRDRLKALRIEIARHKRATLEKRIRAAALRGEKAREDLAREGAAAARAGEEAARLAEERRERESAERRAELEIRDLGAALEGRRREAEQEARRAVELGDDRLRLDRALAEARKRAKALEKEIEAGKKAAAAIRVKDAGLGEKVQALEGRAADLERQAAAAAAEVEQLRRDLVARMQEEAKARNRLGELEARARVLRGREERLTRKQAEVSAALAEREAELAALGKAARQAEERAAALEDDLAAAAARREAAERELRAAEEAFLEARRRQGDVEARVQALRALEKDGEGLDPGVRAVLGLGRDGVLGPVADLLRVERAHAAAIDAALGPRAQSVVVRSREDAVEVARWLAKQNLGRAALVAAGSSPRNAGRKETRKDEKGLPAFLHSSEEDPSFLGWAAEIAKPSDEVKPLVELMLAGTAVVRDLDAAIELAGRDGTARCATLAGEVVEAGPGGALEAGARSGGGRVQRIAERADLEAQAARGEADIEARSTALEALRQKERARALDVERLRSEHNEARLQAFSAKGEREERERGLARIREEARLCGSELAEIVEDLKDAVESLAEVERDAARVRETGAALEGKAGERAAAARAVEAERATVREELHDLRVRLARGAEQFEGLKQAAARAERELAENAVRAQGLEADFERARTRLEESKAAVERLKQEAAALAAEREVREARYQADEAALAEVAKRLEEARAREAGAAEARARAEGGLAAAEREEREATVRFEELAARLRDDLAIELASLEPAPEARPGEPPFNEAAAEREAGGLRRQLEEIGPVNLEALDECDRLGERRKFLSEQLRDLEDAEENLRATIRKINETSRKRFLETFEAVRENFQQIFRKLFGGGKADLFLEDGKDVLEAGVEVTARPPGKEARTLTLLSGGEKVLTTVALLFAVFRAKPGPFCILDEVDAALDEHNVGRFVSLVREFLDRSQFLIITHNKRTMKAADALYGVTMPEQGVSAPIAVRLATAEELAAQTVQPTTEAAAA